MSKTLGSSDVPVRTGKRANRVTIEKIGELLNISTSTVSRALRQDPLIHPETRARVEGKAADLGYRAGGRQAANRPRKNSSIAVLLSHPSQAHVRSSYITNCCLQGLMQETEAAGLGLNLHTVISADQPEFQENAGIPRGLWQDERDVVIVTGRHHEETIARLARKMAVISLVWNYPGATHDLVTTGDAAGMEAIVRELIRLGHTRFAWVGGVPGGSVHSSRRAGFVQACLEEEIALSDLGFLELTQSNETSVGDPTRLLQLHRGGATAFVCSSDYSARLTVDAFRTAGVRVPEDVSVTGFDDNMASESTGSLGLTTIDPHFVEMGRTTVRLVKSRLEHPAALPALISLCPRFVVRTSTGPAPGSGARGLLR